MHLTYLQKKTGDTLSAEELNSIVSEINKKEDSLQAKACQVMITQTVKNKN